MGPAVLMNFYGRHPLFFTQTTEDLKKPRCTANNDSWNGTSWGNGLKRNKN